ncbi:multidrug ABC transporter ATPase [Microbacterium sp.]|uniref:multidrug ABC transporter ATPase n=1 Tax=Microbacterium sp. TaxID=51671 RepID=UPI003F715408
MSTPTPGDDVAISRVDRILSFMSLGMIVVSVVCFFAIMIARPAGVTDFTQGIWPLVTILPLLALPLAFLLILVVLIRAFIRRGRANRGG